MPAAALAATPPKALLPGPPSSTQVHIQEDDSGAMHLRNLSMHRCDTEEQALNMVGPVCLEQACVPAVTAHHHASIVHDLSHCCLRPLRHSLPFCTLT